MHSAHPAAHLAVRKVSQHFGSTPQVCQRKLYLTGIFPLHRFIYSLERLTAFHKPLVDSLRAPLLNILPQVTGMLQSLLLEILQRRAAKLPNLMTEVKPVLPALLASHNYALQNNALQLVKVLLPAEPDEPAGASLLTAECSMSAADMGQDRVTILQIISRR